MRIIAGKKRGSKLYTLDGISTRPTLDRVKESLFNILSSHICDSLVLDLFSGSGALGLEAISRGASKAVLCDNSRQAIGIINKNIEKLKMESETYVINNSFSDAINILKNEKYIFDIIFLDPPYNTDYIAKAVKMILENKVLSKNGIIIAETDECKRVLDELKQIGVDVFDIRKYGRVYILFLKRKG